MLSREELINLMAEVSGRVEKETKETVYKIESLAEAYRYLGGRFTFDADKNLDGQVNKLLILLSDALLDDARTYAADAVDNEDRDRALLWAFRPRDGVSPTERMDSHCSHLKFIIEGWLAVGFANALTSGNILADIFSFPTPTVHPLWQQAKKEGGYNAAILQEGETRWGKGINSNPIAGATLIITDAVSNAWQDAVISSYARAGNIVGYRVHRGSTYDCPYCDSLCEGVHPLSETVLPAHPRCMCFTTPVYEGDLT